MLTDFQINTIENALKTIDNLKGSRNNLVDNWTIFSNFISSELPEYMKRFNPPNDNYSR